MVSHASYNSITNKAVNSANALLARWDTDKRKKKKRIHLFFCNGNGRKNIGPGSYLQEILYGFLMIKNAWNESEHLYLI